MISEAVPPKFVHCSIYEAPESPVHAKLDAVLFAVNVEILVIALPPDGVCQVAAVELVAVSTCPLDGAVAPDTEIVVVALLRPFAAVAVPAVKLLAVPERLVAVPDEGVPRAPPE